MTEEEIQALRDELKNANESITKLESKNSEVIRKNKKLSTEYNEEEFTKLLDKVEELENGNRKLEKANGTLTKDFEKATATITEKDGSLSKLLIDDFGVKGIGLLDKHKAIDVEETNAYAKREGNPQLVDGVAMVGDKTYGDWIKEDLPNLPKAHMYLQANENSGGGAGGGNNGGGGNADRSKMTPDQMMNAGRE
jgi:predicted RNase H-like nuclease (RuvC/YqgF family)